MAGGSIICPIRLTERKEDVLIRSFLKVRSERKMKNQEYLQYVLSIAIERKPIPVIAKVHMRREEPVSSWKFYIHPSNPYYEYLLKLEPSIRASLIRNTLRTCIIEADPDEPDWLMPDIDLQMLALSLGETNRADTTKSMQHKGMYAQRKIVDVHPQSKPNDVRAAESKVPKQMEKPIPGSTDSMPKEEAKSPQKKRLRYNMFSSDDMK